MKAREVPGALALGLLASLLVHATVFGNEHVMGGAYHGWLLTGAVTAALGLAAVFGALAWSCARYAADGSVAGTRLATCLPGFLPLLASTGVWLTLAECAEPAHHASGAAWLAICLAAVTWLVLAVARGAVRMVAEAALAFRHARFSFLDLTSYYEPAPQLVVVTSPPLRRRFARPPPSLAN